MQESAGHDDKVLKRFNSRLKKVEKNPQAKRIGLIMGKKVKVPSAAVEQIRHEAEKALLKEF